MQEPILDVEKLSVSFDDPYHGSTQAVTELSFQLFAGKSLALVGESGSGKSVSALAIMGLLQNTAEVKAQSLRLGSHDLLHVTAEQRRKLRGGSMAMIFQEPMSSLNPLVPVGRQIVEAIRLHKKISHKEAKTKASQLLEQVGLGPTPSFAARYPHELSGGQQQRVMIAMAISCEPLLLIADEPTTALDVTIQKQVIELIVTLQKTYKMALLFITHDLALVADLADDVAVMYQGQLVEINKASELFAAPKAPYTRGLLACRPPLDRRPHRLLTVADFMKQDRQSPLERKDQEATARSIENLGTSPGGAEENLILDIRGLSTYFPARKSLFAAPSLVKAVDKIDLKVKRGMRLGIVGESGCGKTTLARTIIRLIKPTSGSIYFMGQNIVGMSDKNLLPLRKKLQYIFQNPYASLNPRLTVGEILAEPLAIHHPELDRAARLARAKIGLEQVGLREAMLQRYPHEFSGGQRQRICIARVLMLEPELIICDECVSALDVSVQAQIVNLLLDIQERTGITFLFISHDLAVVKYFSEEVCVMSEGHIVERGSSDAIYARPQHPFTKKLLSAIPRGIPQPVVF